MFRFVCQFAAGFVDRGSEKVENETGEYVMIVFTQAIILGGTSILKFKSVAWSG